MFKIKNELIDTLLTRVREFFQNVYMVTSTTFLISFDNDSFVVFP